MLKVALLKLEEDWMKTPWTMRSLIILVTILAIVTFAIGCQGVAGKGFVTTIYQNEKTLLEDLKGYINKDEKLPESSKKIRTDAIDQHWKMIEAEYQRVQAQQEKEGK